MPGSVPHNADLDFLGSGRARALLDPAAAQDATTRAWVEQHDARYHVERFGILTTNTGAQNDTAWASMITDLATLAPHPQRVTIVFGRGTYQFATTKTLDRALDIVGQGVGEFDNGAGANVGTTLQWPVNVGGFIISPQDVGTGNQRNADMVMTGVRLYGGDSATDPPPVAGTDHGILAYSRFHLLNVTIYGFRGDGCKIIGGTGRGPGGVNCFANQGTMKHARAYYNGGNGFTFDGIDANQWQVHGDASANRGWGFDDDLSLLGNHFDTTHNSINLAGPYRSSSTGWSSFKAAYTEGGAPSIGAIVGHKSISIGGDPGAGFQLPVQGMVHNADGTGPYILSNAFRVTGDPGSTAGDIRFDLSTPSIPRIRLVGTFAGFEMWYGPGLTNQAGGLLSGNDGFVAFLTAGKRFKITDPSLNERWVFDLDGRYVEMTEATAAPGNPAADKLRMYVLDAAGQTTLRARDSAGLDEQIWPPTGGGSSGPTTGQVWHVATGRIGV
ncbi:MAG: hypothetical protein ACRCZI_12195 [Cetobacterium sp.]